MAIMTLKEAADYINRQKPDFLQPAKERNQYICPICGHGKGGDGIRFYDNHYKCFGTCGEFHNVLGWYGINRGIPDDNAHFVDMVKGAADYYGLMLEDGNGTDRERTPAKKTSLPVQSKQDPAPVDYTAYLNECAARIQSTNYLTDRGISAETQKAFNIGYDPSYGTKNVNDDGSKSDAKWQTIIIPTSRGSYLARNIDRQATKLNRVRKRGKTHLFFTHKPFDDAPIFITEGEIDALSIYEKGGQAIGIGGLANRNALISMLKNSQDNMKPNQIIIPVLDNDEEGQKGQEALLNLLNEANIPNYEPIGFYDDHKDANDFLTADPEGLKAKIEQVKRESIAAVAKDRKILTPSEEIDAFLDDIRTDRYKPVPTGIDDVDKLLSGGFIRQELITLTAAPGMGKTVLAQQFAENMARNGRSALYFNLEMSKEQMIARSLARIGTDDLTALQILQGYKLTSEQLEAVREAAGIYKDRYGDRLEYNPQYYDTQDKQFKSCDAELNHIVSCIYQKAEAAKKEDQPAPVVFLDYLHLLRDEGKEPAEVIKRALDLFKSYAVTYNTVVFVIIASNRMANAAGRASTDSGRDTSALEYSGDKMLSINYMLTDSENGKTLNEVREAIRDFREHNQEIPQDYRLFSLTLTKSRFTEAPKRIILEFDGAHSRFKQIQQGARLKTDGFVDAAKDKTIPFNQKRNKQRDELIDAYTTLKLEKGSVTLGDMAERLQLTKATIKNRFKEYDEMGFKLMQGDKIIQDSKPADPITIIREQTD